MSTNNMPLDDLRLSEQERLLVQVAISINRLMKDVGMSRTELAKRLGLTKGRVSQILSGQRNLTLRTLADIYTALQSRAEVREATPPRASETWQRVKVPCVQVMRPAETKYRRLRYGSGPGDSMSLAS